MIAHGRRATKASQGESRIAILRSTVSLATRIERTITSTKIIRGAVNKSTLAIFDRMIHACRAIELLVRFGLTSDAKLIARVNYDAFWDLLYLQHDASREAALCLLTACDELVDHWYLNSDFAKSIKRLEHRLWVAKKIKL